MGSGAGSPTVTAGALLVTEMLPDAAVPEVGVKVTVTVAAWLGVSVRGAEEPPVLVNAAPETVRAVMLTFAFPELVRVVVNWLLPPMATELKFKFAGLGVSTSVGATPVPVRVIVLVGAVGSLLARTTVPLTLPAEVGANCTLKLLVPAAGMLIAVPVIPLTV